MSGQKVWPQLAIAVACLGYVYYSESQPGPTPAHHAWLVVVAVVLQLHAGLVMMFPSGAVDTSGISDHMLPKFVQAPPVVGTSRASVPGTTISVQNSAAQHVRRIQRPHVLMDITGPAGRARPPLYTGKEKVDALGAVKDALRKKVVVVTGASSGLGLACVKRLMEMPEYYVVMAVRDIDKAYRVAEDNEFPEDQFKVMKLECGSLQSVRDFVDNLRSWLGPVRLHHLVCNAALYLPTAWDPTFTDDGYEMQVGVNHLSHFLLCNLLVKDMAATPVSTAGAMTIVGSVTGNTNTVAGRFVYPNAGLGDLRGLEPNTRAVMIDGGMYDGAKAYKDAKLCNMITMLELHRRFHKSTGIVFNSMYPGCIVETGLFRQKRAWFRKLFFPFLMKYITRAYVTEADAGDRLAQCVYDPQLNKSGVYWGWNGAANLDGTANLSGTGGSLPTVANALGVEKVDAFEGSLSAEVTDPEQGQRMWDLSCKAVGIKNVIGDEAPQQSMPSLPNLPSIPVPSIPIPSIPVPSIPALNVKS